MVNKSLAKIFQSGTMHLIETTQEWDDEQWFTRLEWNKSTNEAFLTNDQYSRMSLKQPPRKVPKAFYSLKKKKVILAKIIP